jgi:hypothetical protein
MFIYIDIISYYKLFLYFNLCLSVKLDSLLVRNDIYVNEHERLSNITLTQIKVKEQLVVRNDIYVNEHERLSNFTLRHKLK